jgi:hypothetical protein
MKSLTLTKAELIETKKELMITKTELKTTQLTLATLLPTPSSFAQNHEIKTPTIVTTTTAPTISNNNNNNSSTSMMLSFGIFAFGGTQLGPSSVTFICVDGSMKSLPSMPSVRTHGALLCDWVPIFILLAVMFQLRSNGYQQWDVMI